MNPNLFWVGILLNVQFGVFFLLIIFGESLQARVTFGNQNVSKLANEENYLKCSVEVEITVVRTFLTLKDIYNNIWIPQNYELPDIQTEERFFLSNRKLTLKFIQWWRYI